MLDERVLDRLREAMYVVQNCQTRLRDEPESYEVPILIDTRDRALRQAGRYADLIARSLGE